MCNEGTWMEGNLVLSLCGFEAVPALLVLVAARTQALRHFSFTLNAST